MTQTIQKGNFVEISYTGKLTETQAIFDTTDKKVAEENNIVDKKKSYEPVIVCVGENQIMPGLDESLIGKKEKESYHIDIAPEKAFGKKDAKLIKLIPQRKFKEQNINPVPGLTVYVDNSMGFVKTVSAGRVLVDFNHPFSGKSVSYDVTINAIVSDVAKQIESVLSLAKMNATVNFSDKKATIATKDEVPEPMQKVLETHIKHLIKDVSTIEFKKETK